MSSQIICDFCGIVLTEQTRHTATISAPPDINNASGRIVQVDYGPECKDHTLGEALSK